MTPEREAEIRRLLVSEGYLVAMPRSEALAWQAVRELLVALREARQHVCALPQGIQEALNSGGGNYHP